MLALRESCSFIITDPQIGYCTMTICSACAEETNVRKKIYVLQLQPVAGAPTFTFVWPIAKIYLIYSDIEQRLKSFLNHFSAKNNDNS